MSEAERKPLLTRSGSSSAPHTSRSLAASPSGGYGSHASGSTNPTVAAVLKAADAGELHKTLPSHVRAALLKRAKDARRRSIEGGSSLTNDGAHRAGDNSSSSTDSDAEEAELAEIIARTPDIEAIFHPRGSDLHDSSSSSTLGVSSSLANSYGTIKHGNDHSRIPVKHIEVHDGGSDDSSGGGGDSSSSPPKSHRHGILHHHSGDGNVAVGPSTPLSRAVEKSKGKGKGKSLSDSPSAATTSADAYSPNGDRAVLLEELTNPVGSYRRVWLLVIFLFVLYNAVIIPFSLAFQSLWHDMRFFITIVIFNLVGDAFFCLDIVLGFWTPYTRDGMYERNLAEIRSNYLKTWFVPDLISSLPVDLLFFSWGIQGVLLARCTRFIRFAKYGQYFSVWERAATRAPQAVRFFKLMLGLMLILHWLSCMWMWSGYLYGFGATTWLPPHETKHDDVTTQYIAAIWWSTNIITQVGGDPGLPTNNFERVADIFVAFIAVFVVAVVIGNVTELVSELSAEEGERRAKLSVLNNFMFTRRLPDELQKRIRNYYFALWSRRGVNDDGNTSILSELPSNLRTEVSLIMNQDILGKVPIFQASSSGFINSLVLHLKPQTYTPKEFIVKQGDMGAEMYFISRGQVHVMDGDRVVGRIGEGGFFGELACLQENARRTASIQAVNFCDCFVLTHEDLQSLFKTFPAEKAVIMHVAETRRAKDLLRKVLQDPQLLAREHVAGFHDPTLVNLIIDLFQPLDLTHMQRHARRGDADGDRAAATTLTVSGLRIDEHGEIVVGSDEEEDESEEDVARAGLLLSPQDAAQAIYFIGKGCVDIFAHRELEEEGERGERTHIAKRALERQRRRSDAASRRGSVDSSAATESDSEETSGSDEDEGGESDGDLARPQHVIRLTEGHFFGCIAAENYRVSAVLPEEFRSEAIIFALTSHDLHALHDYYNGLPEEDEEDEQRHCATARARQSGLPEPDSPNSPVCQRHAMKKSLVTWLQRHRTPLDYVKSMVSLHVHTQHIQKLAADQQKALSWRMLLKIILQKSKASASKAARAAKNAAQHMTTHITVSAPGAVDGERDTHARRVLPQDRHERKTMTAEQAHTMAGSGGIAAAPDSTAAGAAGAPRVQLIDLPSAPVLPLARASDSEKGAGELATSTAANVPTDRVVMSAAGVVEVATTPSEGAGDPDAPEPASTESQKRYITGLTTTATLTPQDDDSSNSGAQGTTTTSITTTTTTTSSSTSKDSNSGARSTDTGRRPSLGAAVPGLLHTAEREAFVAAAAASAAANASAAASSSPSSTPPSDVRVNVSVSPHLFESPVSRPRRAPNPSIIVSPAPEHNISTEPVGVGAAGSSQSGVVSSATAGSASAGSTGSSVWEQHPGALAAALNLDTGATPAHSPKLDMGGEQQQQPQRQQQLSASASPSLLPTYMRSPPTALSVMQPNLHRSVSMGSPQRVSGSQLSGSLLGAPLASVPASPFSPLVHRPPQTRGVSNSQSVSELLAAADMAANPRHSPTSLGRRTGSSAHSGHAGSDSDLLHSPPVTFDEPHEPLSAGARPNNASSSGMGGGLGGRSQSYAPQQSHLARHRRGQSLASGFELPSAGDLRVPSLEWLTGPSPNLPSSSASVTPSPAPHAGAGNLSTPHLPPNPSDLHSPARRPELKRMPSTPSTGLPPVLPRSPAALAPRAAASSSSSSSSALPAHPPLSARSRGLSMSYTSGGHGGAVQPFSFLLSMAGPQSSAVSSSSASSLGPAPPGLSPSPFTPTHTTLHSPTTSSAKRLSGSGPGTTPTPPAVLGGRRQSIGVQQKKLEFLDRALSHLSSEELLLLANKANLALYSRMQSAQGSAHPATPAAGHFHLSPPVPGQEHAYMHSAAPVRAATTIVSPTTAAERRL